MGFWVRVTIITAIAVLGAVAAGTAVATAGLARLGSVVVPARADEHPVYVDETSRYLGDDTWARHPLTPAAPPAPVHRGGTVAAPMDAPSSTASTLPGASLVPPLTSTPYQLTDPSSLLGQELSRAGLISGPGCSGAACGTAGCGFLAPGCALLDCSLLNPACGLGFDVGIGGCGSFDPFCSGGFGGRCRFFGSGCGVDGCDGCDLFGDRFVDLGFGRRFHFSDHVHRDRRGDRR